MMELPSTPLRLIIPLSPLRLTTQNFHFLLFHLILSPSSSKFNSKFLGELLSCVVIQIKQTKLKNIEDKLLLKQVARGNKLAFDKLFRKYYEQLVRFALGYTHDGLDAEELVQDVFVKLWEQAAHIKVEVSVQAYLYTSVRNKALNVIKHDKVRQKFAEQQRANDIKTFETQEELPDLNQFRKLLLLALEKLPERCRTVFEMGKFEGLSYDEIAVYLEISSKTVENQMGLALKKLREAMQPAMNEIYES
jgi:RNA polymerase sigma-70 factor (ECF subfamily)